MTSRPKGATGPRSCRAARWPRPLLAAALGLATILAGVLLFGGGVGAAGRVFATGYRSTSKAMTGRDTTAMARSSGAAGIPPDHGQPPPASHTAGRMGSTGRVASHLPPPPTGPEGSGLVPIVPASPPGWTITATQTESGGMNRYYLVARPDVVTAPSLPVLVVLHGRNLTPATMELISGFLPVVGQAVVVYPAGFHESWNAGYCCAAAVEHHIDDVSFVESAVRQVLATQPGTSARQVYLVGYSNGGRLAYRLACQDPGAFAGIAAVHAVAVSGCPSTRPVPLLAVASTRDPMVSIAGPPKHIAGHTEMTVDGLAAHWRQLEGCQPASTTAASGMLSTSSWTCAAPGRVEVAVYHGGSHAWPAGGPGTPSAQALIWAFFRGLTPPT